LPLVAHCGERNVLLPLLQARGAASKAPGSLPDLPFSVNNTSRSNVHGDGGGSTNSPPQSAAHPSPARPVTHKKLQQILRTDLAAEVMHAEPCVSSHLSANSRVLAADQTTRPAFAFCVLFRKRLLRCTVASKLCWAAAPT
jgi:hypothetical protein